MKDLSQLSEKDLQAELARRREEKRDLRDQYKELSNEVIPGLFQRLEQVSKELSKVKASVFEDILALTELKIDAYGVKANQQSHTFSTDKGETLTIGFNVNVGYDDSVYIGIAKVKEFINSQIKDETTAKLVNQIHRLLRMDSKGNLDPRRVMELKQMANEFNDLNFIEGVEIIEAAYQPKRSSWYIKAGYRNTSGIDVNLPLSISTVDFSKDLDLTLLLPEDE